MRAYRTLVPTLRSVSRLGTSSLSNVVHIGEHRTDLAFVRLSGMSLPLQLLVTGATSGHGRSRSATRAKSKSNCSSWWRPMT